MAFYGDADIAACLKDCGGVVVAAGGLTSYGALNLNDKVIVQDAQRGEVHAQVPSVEVQTSAFPAAAIAIDSPLTVDGVSYFVRDHDSPGDGAVIKLFLRKA
jgi:phosphohistidine swiveling domain-containing protein